MTHFLHLMLYSAEEKSEFDEAWRQHAEKSLPGWSWNRNTAMLEHGNRGEVLRKKFRFEKDDGVTFLMFFIFQFTFKSQK